MKSDLTEDQHLVVGSVEFGEPLEKRADDELRTIIEVPDYKPTLEVKVRSIKIWFGKRVAEVDILKDGKVIQSATLSDGESVEVE